MLKWQARSRWVPNVQTWVARWTFDRRHTVTHVRHAVVAEHEQTGNKKESTTSSPAYGVHSRPRQLAHALAVELLPDSHRRLLLRAEMQVREKERNEKDGCGYTSFISDASREDNPSFLRKKGVEHAHALVW